METQLNRGKSAIQSSIIKNGIYNFILEILIYCSPEECIFLACAAKIDKFIKTRVQYIENCWFVFGIQTFRGNSCSFLKKINILYQGVGGRSPPTPPPGKMQQVVNTLNITYRSIITGQGSKRYSHIKYSNEIKKIN